MSGIFFGHHFVAGGGGGGGGEGVSIDDDESSQVDAVTYLLKSTGDIQKRNALGVMVDVGDWLTPKIGMAGYQVQATVVSWSGHPPTGLFGAWYPLSADQGWGALSSAGINSLCVITVEIRLGTGPTIDSATINLNAYDGMIP